ncbi:enoyl-CoA hydratase/isomerase family protein [Streptomyces pratens]|uniref:3-hydroxyisobutyryl-CoA hydrolase n=1 Tax=Streptomyces pratens TaxID=887456 RepID=A0ABW1LSP3_9ACTN
MSDQSTIEPSVLAERRGPLGLLTLNRPRSINALTHEMVGLLQAALDDWATDPDVTAVVVKGAGTRGLCAGGDIVSIYQDAVSGGHGAVDFWRDEYRLNAFIASYPKPYVALMDGIVLGGGVGVSAHASHRVVTDKTRVGMPETGIGFVPDVGGTWLLSRAPGELGTLVALTAGHMTAGDAIELGLADHFVDSADLETLVDLLVDHPVDEALTKVARPAPPSKLAEQRTWVDAAFAHNTVAEILDALNRRPEPEAAEALTAIRSKSPTSLVVTLRALRAARRMTRLEEALAQEFRLAVRLLRGHDMAEGIRAQVIDKDRNPRWEPPQVADVDPVEVDAHFASLGDAELELDPTSSVGPAAAPEQEGTA